jgi:hypothetical protein
MLDQRKIKFEHVKEENLELVSVFFLLGFFIYFFVFIEFLHSLFCPVKIPHHNIVYFEIKIK